MFTCTAIADIDGCQFLEFSFVLPTRCHQNIILEPVSKLVFLFGKLRALSKNNWKKRQKQVSLYNILGKNEGNQGESQKLIKKEDNKIKRTEC